MLKKKSLFKSNVSTAFQSWPQYVAEVWVCSETVHCPLDSMSSVVPSLHCMGGPAVLVPRVVSEHDETLWNIAAPVSSWQSPAHFFRMVMKLIPTLNSGGVANVVDTEWQDDNAVRWAGYSLGKRCRTWSFTTIHLSVSEHSVISASGQMKISTEDTQKAGWGKCCSKWNNSVTRLPGVNVCNSKHGNTGDKQHWGPANYTWMDKFK